MKEKEIALDMTQKCLFALSFLVLFFSGQQVFKVIFGNILEEGYNRYKCPSLSFELVQTYSCLTSKTRKAKEKKMSDDHALAADEKVVYTSAERGGAYNCLRTLWCGCCEPYHVITNKWVKEDYWKGCSTYTDSMSMESISDVKRLQSCWCVLGSCCCSCCVFDMADIVVYGSDASTKSKNGWRLKNVANSERVTDDLTKILQAINADFRQKGRNLGKKLQEVKDKADVE
ncbi:hypothetical protein RFI_30541 [Reticulomyxa filosa]|uniref:Uncharacterized protein n=1 Tax=Reticulomyxa filosa TaxID=46433 RepID=X6M1J4_RETFI|nr:hypothetical protein RFI_30541 [Reticulomyxa filosa]|eukprot:ETO06850.1 hypothetical protein RFI_30541 [Reticulomyxa filosa]